MSVSKIQPRHLLYISGVVDLDTTLEFGLGDRQLLVADRYKNTVSFTIEN